MKYVKPFQELQRSLQGLEVFYSYSILFLASCQVSAIYFGAETGIKAGADGEEEENDMVNIRCGDNVVIFIGLKNSGK